MPTFTKTIGANAVVRKARTKAVGVSAQLLPATFVRTSTVRVTGVLQDTLSLTLGIDAALDPATFLTKTIGVNAYLLADGTQKNVAISAYLLFMPGTKTEPFRLFRARKSRR